MNFDTRKRIETKDEYVGGLENFELLTDNNSRVEAWGCYYETWADWYHVELSVYDLEDKDYNISLHVCHCQLRWDNNYVDELGNSGGYDSYTCPPSGQILASNPYHGDINAVKDACKVLTERVRWSFSDADFLAFKRALLAAFADFCKVYYN